MNTELPMECPICGEISLVRQDTDDEGPTPVVYECLECNHEEVLVRLS